MYLCSCNFFNLPDHFQVYQQLERHADLSSILSTLSPFLIAFLIAYFINPLVNRIDHILFSRTTSQKFAKLHKFLSLLLAYVIVIGFIALVLTFVIPQIVESILELIRQSSSLYDTIMTNLNLLNRRCEYDFCLYHRHHQQCAAECYQFGSGSDDRHRTDDLQCRYVHYQLDYQYHSGLLLFRVI